MKAGRRTGRLGGGCKRPHPPKVWPSRVILGFRQSPQLFFFLFLFLVSFLLFGDYCTYYTIPFNLQGYEQAVHTLHQPTTLHVRRIVLRCTCSCSIVHTQDYAHRRVFPAPRWISSGNSHLARLGQGLVSGLAGIRGGAPPKPTAFSRGVGRDSKVGTHNERLVSTTYDEYENMQR